MSNPVIEILTAQLGTKKAATDSLHITCTAIKNALIENGEVRLPGIGIIMTSERAARKGRNPTTGEAIMIEAKKTARLKPAADLKRALNGE